MISPRGWTGSRNVTGTTRDWRRAELLAFDNKFRTLGKGEIQDKASQVLEDLDDLAVLLLFSVFEAEVRRQTLEGVERELTIPPRHPALNDAVDEMKDTIRNGSFGTLTRMYRNLDPDLKTQVDQVRKFRNWVAHGRRGDAENEVTPEQSRRAPREVPRPAGILGAGDTRRHLIDHRFQISST